MTNPYTYIPSPQYIQNLAFDYIETYSFQRGEEFEQNIKQMAAEYEKLNMQKENGVELSDEHKDRLSAFHQLLNLTRYIINGDGQFHPSAKKINTFPAGDPAIEKIKNILATKSTTFPDGCVRLFTGMHWYFTTGKIRSYLR